MSPVIHFHFQLPLGKLMLLIHNFRSVGLEGLEPREKVFSLGDTTRISLNFMLWLLPCLCELLMPRDQRARGGMTLTAQVIVFNQQKGGLLLHDGEL